MDGPWHTGFRCQSSGEGWYVFIRIPRLSIQAQRPTNLFKPQSQFLAVAKPIAIDHIAQPGNMVVVAGLASQADEVMADGVAESSAETPSPYPCPAGQVSEASPPLEKTTAGAAQTEKAPPRRPSLQAHASRTQTAEMPLSNLISASRTGTLTAYTPIPAWCGGDDIPEAQAPKADTKKTAMPPPESFTPRDLAMENNPIVKAGNPSTPHDMRTDPAGSVHSDLGDTTGSSMLPETPSTGCLVPPAATLPLKITFEGA